jgi:hypothetical protein
MASETDTTDKAQPNKKKATDKAQTDEAEPDEATSNGSADYVLPLVHLSVPSAIVNVGFWGGLGGAVALGAVDPPLGVLVGAGVIIARHGSR